MAYLLQRLLEASARRDPGKEAVTCRGKSLSYGELDRLSDGVAHLLRDHGIGRGDRVGICLNKSVKAVVAIFGVLKAGGVYVPLDPLAPPRRLAFIVQNCRMKALVGIPNKLSSLAQALTGPCPVTCVLLAQEGELQITGPLAEARVLRWEEVAASAYGKIPDEVIEDDLAYILYTSGSTGEPKGVMISHRASLTFVNWAFEEIRVSPADRVANHAPFHFDLSIFDIFATIKGGASLVLVPEELSPFPRSLADFIDAEGLTIWYSVPSILTFLVVHGDLARHRFSHLKKVLFAGEVFPVKYLRQLVEAIPHAQYYNLYGPTETNVCTFYQVKEIPSDPSWSVPIGKACANTEVFVINERNERAAPGEIGELCVRGPSVMKGYWGLPEKSKQVLVPNLFSPQSGERIYRTGDLVRQAQDGNYIFLGRRDHMVKSRGYRIELGEIEAALYSHPEVEDAAVIAIPDEEIGSFIKALVVPRSLSGLTGNDLKSFCSDRLPRYMIPGSIDLRPSLPKTSTGKIDRTLLVREHMSS